MRLAHDKEVFPYVMGLSGLILAAGIWLSADVYQDTRALNAETIALVDQGIPTLNHLSALRSEIAMQEAILYEFYATTDASAFDTRWDSSRRAIAEHWSAIKSARPDHAHIAGIEAHDGELLALAGKLEDILRHPPVDWDESRRLLELITHHAVIINATLTDFAEDFHQDMHSQGNVAQDRVRTLNRAVLVYAVSVLLAAALAGLLLHLHLRGIRERKRLAMFVERNPSPVLRLTRDGLVEYANPGARATLMALGAQHDSAAVLLPNDVRGRIRELTMQNRDWERWEYRALGRDYEAAVHYLRDFGVFHAYLLDVTERKAARQELEYLAYHDPLTELPNRRGFVRDIESAIATGRDFSVLLVRMERLRRVVDGIGHGVMDQMTRALSARLQGILSECCAGARHAQAYRYEANVYGVLLPEVTSTQVVTEFALTLALRFEDVIMVGRHEVFPGASVGISRHPIDGHDAINLISHADQAMQHIEKGDIRFQLYESSFTNQARERMALERDLRHALERQELILLYQPQAEVDSGRIIAAEALLRWQHPVRGLIPPTLLIPIAEESGLIQEIGQWILHTACAQAQEWRLSGLPLQRIAVNLSVRQFTSRDLIPMVSRTLAATGLPATALELEITESLAMDDVPYSIDMLHALKELGVGIALDDFGTGYSSLAYLRHLPLDKLKVDKSFVSNLELDMADAILVKTICDLSHTLRLRTVAEGIETIGQLKYLRQVGCEEAQGYLFSQPVMAEEFARLVGTARIPDGGILVEPCPNETPDPHTVTGFPGTP